jgi:hypothetical protein
VIELDDILRVIKLARLSGLKSAFVRQIIQARSNKPPIRAQKGHLVPLRSTMFLRKFCFASLLLPTALLAITATTTTITADSPNPSAPFRLIVVHVAVQPNISVAGSPSGQVILRDGPLDDIYTTSCAAFLSGAPSSAPGQLMHAKGKAFRLQLI